MVVSNQILSPKKQPKPCSSSKRIKMSQSFILSINPTFQISSSRVTTRILPCSRERQMPATSSMLQLNKSSQAESDLQAINFSLTSNQSGWISKKKTRWKTWKEVSEWAACPINTRATSTWQISLPWKSFRLPICSLTISQVTMLSTTLSITLTANSNNSCRVCSKYLRTRENLPPSRNWWKLQSLVDQMLLPDRKRQHCSWDSSLTVRSAWST